MNGYVLTFGETMGLVRATDIGDLADVSLARLGSGGADSNVAIGLSRLGVEAVWVGRVGDDGFGRRVLRDLRAEEVHLRAIVDPHAFTGLMVKEKRTPHTSRVSFYRAGSAGSRLAPGDVDPELVRGARMVHISGITASLSASARDLVREVVECARENSIPISFDVNHRSSLWREGDPRPLYREIAAQAQFVFAGEDEAAIVTGHSVEEPEALARGLAELGPTTAILKRGAGGSIAVRDGVVMEQPAIVVPVVDSVGAGDAFVAGFLAAHLAGEGLGACLELASVSGAFACTGPGDWESMPRVSDLELFSGNDPVTR